ncbi:MAG: hypothetical protein HC828_13375 [Blastochloris sp.]|nr:hypothetical protein [Blastochloris sp.]
MLRAGDRPGDEQAEYVAAESPGVPGVYRQRGAAPAARRGAPHYPVVAPTAPRIQAIARTVAGIYHGAIPPYRFLEERHVHPFAIRRRWQQIQAVEQRPLVQHGRTTTHTAIQFADVALWTPQEEPV